MLVSSLLASLVKGIPWVKVAGLAVEYAPGLYRQVRERSRPEAAPVAAAATTVLQERVARLETLLLEQEELLRTRVVTIELLEKRCLDLEKSLLVLQVTAGVLTLGCIILLAVLFT